MISAHKPISRQGLQLNSHDVLAKHCRNVTPVISVHVLRHTHASLPLFAGVSIASVTLSRPCQHDYNLEETYLHVIRELENKDVDIVMCGH